MAIALDAVTDQAQASGSTYSFSHTCTGSNLILWVGIFGDTTDTLTGITYNGVAMTVYQKVGMGFGDRWIYLCYLVNPATGSNTVEATFSASTFAKAVAVSYTGAKQTGQPDNGNNWTDLFTASISHSVTTVADNCWMVFIAKTNGVGTPTAGTGSTSRGGSNSFSFFDSNGAITPAGSYTMECSVGGSAVWGSCMASFSPAVSSSNFRPRMMLMGCG